MTTKHTPGPWSTDCSEHDCRYQDITVRAGRRNICRVWIDDAPVPDYNAEQAANARVIASSPELLAALQAIKQRVQGNSYGMGGDVAEIADEAIAKATGAQP